MPRVRARRVVTRWRGVSEQGRHIWRRRQRVWIFCVLFCASVVIMYPFYFMITTSFRSSYQYETGKAGVSLSSWSSLFASVPVLREIANSLLVCLASIVVIVCITALAGFAFAKARFRGSGVCLAGVVACWMLPVQSFILPEYTNIVRLHLLGYAGTVLVYVAVGSPFATFLMTTYFRGIPVELIEAGLCDGLSVWGIFRRIALPMAKPAIATVVVLQFIPIWNDLLIALLFLQSSSLRTLTVGLAVLESSRVVSVPSIMAGSLLSTIPAAGVYVAFQRYLVSGLTLGTEK